MICQVYTEENYILLSFNVSICVSVSQLKIPVGETQRLFSTRTEIWRNTGTCERQGKRHADK